MEVFDWAVNFQVVLSLLCNQTTPNLETPQAPPDNLKLQPLVMKLSTAIMNPLSLLFLASFQSLIGGDHGDKGAGIGNSNGRIVNLEVDENGFDDNTVGFAPSMLRIKVFFFFFWVK